MAVPTISLNISGNLIAIYAAALATATAVVQILNFYKDRAKVKFGLRKNMSAVGMGERYAGLTMTIITATNAGRRPLTMNGFAFHYLYRKGERETDSYLFDVRPAIPCEITEGQQVSAFVNEAGVDFSTISHWYAWDTTGRHYRLNVAPWHRRWLSSFKRWKAPAVST